MVRRRPQPRLLVLRTARNGFVALVKGTVVMLQSKANIRSNHVSRTNSENFKWSIMNFTTCNNGKRECPHTELSADQEGLLFLSFMQSPFQAFTCMWMVVKVLVSGVRA